MTNLTRTPARSLRTLQNEIDQVFDRLFPSGGDYEEGNTRVWAPRTDMVETNDNYVIRLDLPGMKKEDLHINLQDRQLSVSGERHHEKQNKDSEFVRVERSFGRFYRSFTLPRTVKESGIKADYANGVLTITVPKAEESKPRQIKVN